MSDPSLEFCENLHGMPCIDAPIEVSEAMPLDWEPVVLGVGFSIQYIGLDGVLYTHQFTPSEESAALLSDVDSDNLSPETAKALSGSAALLMADPDDNFLLINNVRLTELGIEDIE